MLLFNGTDGIPVYINPNQVVGLKRIGEATYIYVNTPNHNNWPFAFVVHDAVEEVAGRIGLAL